MRTETVLLRSSIHAILDARYYTGANADALHYAGLSFITRLKSGHLQLTNEVKSVRLINVVILVRVFPKAAIE